MIKPYGIMPPKCSQARPNTEPQSTCGAAGACSRRRRKKGSCLRVIRSTGNLIAFAAPAHRRRREANCRHRPSGRIIVRCFLANLGQKRFATSSGNVGCLSWTPCLSFSTRSAFRRKPPGSTRISHPGSLRPLAVAAGGAICVGARGPFCLGVGAMEPEVLHWLRGDPAWQTWNPGLKHGDMGTRRIQNADGHSSR